MKNYIILAIILIVVIRSLFHEPPEPASKTLDDTYNELVSNSMQPDDVNSIAVDQDFARQFPSMDEHSLKLLTWLQMKLSAGHVNYDIRQEVYSIVDRNGYNIFRSATSFSYAVDNGQLALKFAVPGSCIELEYAGGDLMNADIVRRR